MKEWYKTRPDGTFAKYPEEWTPKDDGFEEVGFSIDTESPFIDITMQRVKVTSKINPWIAEFYKIENKFYFKITLISQNEGSLK